VHLAEWELRDTVSAMSQIVFHTSSKRIRKHLQRVAKLETCKHPESAEHAQDYPRDVSSWPIKPRQKRDGAADHQQQVHRAQYIARRDERERLRSRSGPQRTVKQWQHSKTLLLSVHDFGVACQHD
jgi:hypothetical protein